MTVKAYALGFLALGLGACGASSSGGIDPQTPIHQAQGFGDVSFGQVLSAVAGHDPAIKPEFVSHTVHPRCRMPRASSGSHMAYIYSYGGGFKSPMAHAYKKAHEGSVEYHQRTDVIVTETEVPVYLVLESYNAVLWNIQLAPGAQLEGVGVLSYEGGAVSGVPEGVDVGFLAFRGVENKRCFERGGMMTPTDIRVERAAANNYTATASDRQNWDAEYRAAKTWRNRWVPQTFGARFDVEIFPDGSDDYDAVLVGPVPATPIAPTPIIRVHTPDHVHVAWGNRDEVLAEFDAIARQELEALMN